MFRFTGLTILFIGQLTCYFPLERQSVSAQSDSTRVSQPDEKYLVRLNTLGIEAKFSSIKRYFDDLKPSSEKRTKVRELIKRLSSEDFHQRKAAMKGLVSVPALPRSELTGIEASGDKDLEWRIQQILRTTDKQKDEVFVAVLEAIEKKKIKGLYASILESAPEFNLNRNEKRLHLALSATYTKNEFELAKAGLTAATSESKKASIFVLTHHAAESIDQLFQNYIEKQDDDIQLFAARNLADIGNRNSLQLLVGLLDSQDLKCRSGAISVLRRFTKQNLGYVAYTDAKGRADKSKAWQAWLKESGPTTKLHFPLKGLEVPFTGKFLVCNYSQNFIYAMNEKGDVLWKKDNIKHPWGAQVLPNGNYLVAACTGKQLLEFDQEGKEIWKVESIEGSPLSVQRLENGNTLVSTGSTGKVLEYGPDKKIVNSIHLGGFVADSQRLDNGRTLVTRYRAGSIVEIDAKGKVLWELKGYTRPRSARRLPNGNTLITDNGAHRVVEVDRDGKVVYELKGLTSPFDSFRLEDGRTVVTGSQTVQMFDAKGKSEWSHQKLYNSRVFPF